MPIPTNSCSNCGSAVKQRRPSETGEHYCSQPGCQAARQVAFRARRKKIKQAIERGEAYTVDESRRRFLDAALNQPRVVCGACGLQNAVNGYFHRDAPGSRSPCYQCGNLGADLGPGWLDLANPELDPNRPEYAGDKQ